MYLIKELFKMPNLKAPKGGHEAFLSHFSYRMMQDQYERLLKQLPDVVKSPTLIGIEVEVEDIVYAQDHCPPNWKPIPDHSLRNDGREFVSTPLNPDEVPQNIAALWVFLRKLTGRKPDFSWRTSIHIHVNVRDMTTEELLKFILLYTVFEPVLFDFADREREKSNFCVPLRESVLGDSVYQFKKTQDITMLLKDWGKYSAFNLFRLKDYGTVEFRHMAGVDDPEKIVNWVNLLLALFNKAKTISLDSLQMEILSLNTKSHYEAFREIVFEDHEKLLKVPGFGKRMSLGVRFAKECLLGENYVDIKPSGDSAIVSVVKKEREKLKKKEGEQSKNVVSPDEALAAAAMQTLMSQLIDSGLMGQSTQATQNPTIQQQYTTVTFPQNSYQYIITDDPNDF